MKIGFVVNRVATELAAYTTTRLALTATARGHDVWLIGLADFVYDADGSIHALAATAERRDYDGAEDYLAALQAVDLERDRICVDTLDVLMLRYDPAEESTERPWAQTSAILFGQLAASRGVVVLNDPENLADAINKTYFQRFPESVRPEACISCSTEEIKQFIADHGGEGVIKPLQGSGGHGVFIVRPGDRANLNQMIEAVTRDGYAVAQEYLPSAAAGDVRLFVMNGRILEHRGGVAMFRRMSHDGDGRSNISAGGTIEAAEMTDEIRRIVEIVRPKLVRDGMHLVGLDIVGDKLMEINVFSPGGLNTLAQLTGIDFTEAVIADLELKIRHKHDYGPTLGNTRLATL